MKLSFPCILSSVALAALLTWLIAWHPLSWSGPVKPCRIEVQVASAAPTQMTVRLDEGHGTEDWQPSDLVADLPADRDTRPLTMALPPQRVRALRLTFPFTSAVLITGARLVFEDRPPLDFFAQLKAAGSTTLTPRDGGGVILKPGPHERNIAVEWLPEPPLSLPSGDEPAIPVVVLSMAVLTALFIGLQSALDRPSSESLRSGVARFHAGFCRVAGKVPVLVLAGVGVGAAAISSYPVVFCHKSFVSPNIFPYLLYTGSPAVPGAPKEPIENTNGSDVAAMMVYCLPNSAVEHDALFRDHEWPLWNRYVSAGLPLFGQGQSMVGNPLHFLAIAANAASWAWDLKFLIAKALFSFGLGLCVWMLTRRLGVSALIGASGAWLGFFGYRINHPAFFSLCFAPWVLLPWLCASAGATRRAMLGAAIGLVLADWCELTSGTAKEASMLLVFMNMAGLLVLASGTGSRISRWRRLAVLAGASLCFLFLSAPHWLLFIDAMRHGVSWYEAPVANQLSPGILVGFFDDLFSQDISPDEIHTHPSANFLVLAGVLWLAAGGVGRKRRAATLALAWTCIPLAALVFGVVPPAWIEATPLLGNIYHIFNTFGLPLIVLLLLLAGIGLSESLAPISSRHWNAIHTRLAIALAGLLALYLGCAQAAPPLPLPAFRQDPPWHSRFFLGYAPALILAVLLLPWALRWLREKNPHRLAGALMLGVCLVVLHFRHGMYVRTRFDGYVVTPRSAARLDAPSAALENIRAHLDEPWRTAGFELTFSPDYNALARLEGISNLDAFSNPYFLALLRATHFHEMNNARTFLLQKELSSFKPVLDFLNVRFYLRERKPGMPPMPTPAGLTPAGTADLEIFESHEAWPRAFFTDQTVPCTDAADFVSILQHGDGRPFAAVESDSASPGQRPPPERKIVPATSYRLTSNVTEFDVEAPGPGIIVLDEAFEEDNFRVTLNGTAVPYLRVNQTFKGVRAEHAGPYRLRFEYWPHLLSPALGLCAFGALLSLASAAWLLRRPQDWFTTAEVSPATSAKASNQSPPSC